MDILTGQRLGFCEAGVLRAERLRAGLSAERRFGQVIAMPEAGAYTINAQGERMQMGRTKRLPYSAAGVANRPMRFSTASGNGSHNSLNNARQSASVSFSDRAAAWMKPRVVWCA